MDEGFNEWFDAAFPEEGYPSDCMDRGEMKDIMSTAWSAGVEIGEASLSRPVDY